MNAIAIAAHVLAAVVWVGGMFFAYVILRPTLMSEELEPSIRLKIWAGVFRRFFPWVWLVIPVLLLSGYWLVFKVFGGFGGAPIPIHIMHMLGLVMMILFAFLYYRILPQFRSSVSEAVWPSAASALNRIRQILLVNLVLGFVVIVFASAGRYSSALLGQ